jgi:outer membrane protein assembly factor BamB
MNGISLEQNSPTVLNNIVYTGSYRNISSPSIKGSLYAINATTGALVWEILQNTGFNSSPVIDNGILFITSEGGDLFAVDILTGLQLWSRTIYSNGSNPVVMNGVVYVGGGGTNNIYAIDIATRADKWKFPITNSATTSGSCVVTATSTKHTGDSGMQQ